MYARRRRAYFLMMGGCLVLFVSSWAFVRLWSIPAAISMCVIAMVIPPVAAIVANRKGPEDRWWDDPPPGPRQRTDEQRTNRQRTDKRRTDKKNPAGPANSSGPA
ncbi:DUF3099 domain-containing protein, partial [Streptomyces sp. AC154]|uniref:DUF3099 domain-containing protein n=1 Tax=Streptomyces sp. AC154 TaxID=3143184 RepID=UPI003F7DAE56